MYRSTAGRHSVRSSCRLGNLDDARGGRDEIDAASEQARERSLAARAEAERADHEAEIMERHAREQCAAAAAERDLPHSFRAS